MSPSVVNISLMKATPLIFEPGTPHAKLIDLIGSNNKAEIARKANIPAPLLSMILAGKRRCTPDTARGLSRALHCPYRDIVQMRAARSTKRKAT